MKITIIFPDNIITVNGVSKTIDLSSYYNLHAIQFDSEIDKGHVEYRDNHNPNDIINGADFSEAYQHFIDLFDSTTVTPQPSPLTLAEVKALKIDSFTQSRDTAISSNFSYNQVPYDSDPTSRANVTAQLTAINAGVVTDPIYWRAKDNTIQVLSSPQFTELAAALLLHVASIYQQSWVLKDQVENATTIAEVENILWV